MMKLANLGILTSIIFCACTNTKQPKIDMDKVNDIVIVSSIETGLANKILRDEVAKHSDSLRNETEKLNKIVGEFNAYMTELTEAFIERAGGYDESGKPVMYKDKNVTHQFFLTEKKGEELKNKIEATRAQILSFVAKEYVAELSKSILLTTEDAYVIKSGKKWENARFENMPVAAVLPNLTLCSVNANNAEKVILDYWKIKHK